MYRLYLVDPALPVDPVVQLDLEVLVLLPDRVYRLVPMIQEFLMILAVPYCPCYPDLLVFPVFQRTQPVPRRRSDQDFLHFQEIQAIRERRSVRDYRLDPALLKVRVRLVHHPDQLVQVVLEILEYRVVQHFRVYQYYRVNHCCLEYLDYQVSHSVLVIQVLQRYRLVQASRKCLMRRTDLPDPVNLYFQLIQLLRTIPVHHQVLALPLVLVLQELRKDQLPRSVPHCPTIQHCLERQLALVYRLILSTLGVLVVPQHPRVHLDLFHLLLQSSLDCRLHRYFPVVLEIRDFRLARDCR